MRFESKKSFFLPGLVALLVATVCAVLILEPVSDTEAIVLLVCFAIPIFLLLWFYLSTYYVVSDGNLKYASGFLVGDISIQTIRRIEIGKIMWSGIRPALSFDGMVVNYNKWSRIYISPENKEAFIGELLSYNASIEVVDAKKKP